MNSFEFYSPTKVIFGKGVENQVGEEIKKWGGSRILVHYGTGSVKKSGLLDRVEAALKEAGLYYVSLGGAQPNPHLSLVHEGIELARKEKIDFILAVGGGSAMDAGKIMWVMYEHPEVDFQDMAMRFMDIRKRVYTFPKMGEGTSLPWQPPEARPATAR